MSCKSSVNLFKKIAVQLRAGSKADEMEEYQPDQEDTENQNEEFRVTVTDYTERVRPQNNCHENDKSYDADKKNKMSEKNIDRGWE